MTALYLKKLRERKVNEEIVMPYYWHSKLRHSVSQQSFAQLFC